MATTTDYRGKMHTASGGTLDLRNPKPEQIRIEDIAHGLSHICRWSGHCRHFYSVAEHSVEVARLVSTENVRYALLHDAPEAYLGDLSRPLKQLCPDYEALEAKLWRVIAEKYGLPLEMPAEVKLADDRRLVTEARYLMPRPETMTLAPGVEASDQRPRPLSPEVARATFLSWFDFSNL